MTTKIRTAATLAAVAGFLLLFATGCATPARPEQMGGTAMPLPEASGPPAIATLHVTVYGDYVGGFASHFYPLPREDFEAALLATIARDKSFAATNDREAADYALTVGLISLVAPQWSGTVTLETSWGVSVASTREEVARQMVKTATPSPFSKVREATENSARTNIEAGLAWLREELAPREPNATD